MKDVFVTGASGFVGSHLCARLVEKGCRVHALARKSSSLRWISGLPLKMVYGDLDRPESYQSVLSGCDTVFHVAGVTKARTREDYMNGNFRNTRILADTLLSLGGKGRRFILVGSQAAYGPSPSLEPITEEHSPRPLTWYGESKLLAQQYIRGHARDLQASIACPPAVYGPRDTDVLQFFKTVKMGLIPQLEGRDRYASFIYADDLARGLILMAEHPAALGETFFLADSRPYAWSELSRITLDILGRRGLTVPVPMALMKTIAAGADVLNRFKKKPSIISGQKLIEMRQDFWVCSPKKAETQLGFKTEMDIYEGIRQTLEWYTQHGWI
ncbi:MAG TPA: NAD-dependent epimerase/dehydratase family protein [Caldithrix abyssi]|uniref:NAD-dependent epimerase/dehydratase family protein n=1 Tax=Caldithrix abyssi TaxID=187145 RepID=A0A7V5RR51_CALAY|nr:NAD-dependent epimerase/dehydratase family protein [Caldithrix abyssi]